VTLKPPQWLKEDEETLKVWKDIVKKLRGIELLDNIDSELLAMYCRALVHCRQMEQQMVMKSHSEDGEKQPPIDEPMKLLQGWNRIATSLAEKLGLTPGGRARLAKRKAEKILDPFADTFGG
jgi:P27 family predicted phage terminase small subunit